MLTAVIGIASICLCAEAWKRAANLQRGRCGAGISVSSLMFLYYGLTYGVGAVYFAVTRQADPRYEPGADFLARATAMGLVAVLGLRVALTWSVFTSSGRQQQVVVINKRFPVELATLLIIIGYLSRFGELMTGRFFHRRDTLESTNIGLLLTVAGLFPLIVLGAWSYRDFTGRGRLQRWTWVLLTTELAVALPRGGREDVLSPMIAVTLAALAAGQGRKLLNRRVVFTAAISIFLIFPSVAHFRGDQNVDLTRSIGQRAVGALESTLVQPPTELLKAGTESVLNRFSDPVIVAKGLEAGLGKSWPATTSTETLAWSLTTLLPRWLVPTKADPGKFGHDYGVRVGIVQPGDNFTSVTVGHPVEMYVAARWVGVFFGNLLIGLVVQFLDRLFARRFPDPIWMGLFTVWGWTFGRSPATIVSSGFMMGLRGLALTAIIAVGLRRLLNSQFLSDTPIHLHVRPVVSSKSRTE